MSHFGIKKRSNFTSWSNNLCSRANNDFFLWHKLRLQCYQVTGHVNSKLLQLTKERSLLFVCHFVKFNFQFNLNRLKDSRYAINPNDIVLYMCTYKTLACIYMYAVTV